MIPSISEAVIGGNQDFSMWDFMSYSDASLPFGDIVSADQVRELFVGHDALFGSGETDVWNTGQTWWSFIGQVLADGKQRSCNAAVTHATRYRLEHGLEPPGASEAQQRCCQTVGLSSRSSPLPCKPGSINGGAKLSHLAGGPPSTRADSSTLT